MANVYTETLSVAGLIGWASANENYEVLEAAFPHLDRDQIENIVSNPELVVSETVEIEIKSED